MKLSEFNYPFFHNNQEGIFNTFSGSIVLFDSAVENPLKTPLCDIDSDLIHKYQKLGLIIEESFDERQVLLKSRKDVINRKTKPFFRILTTTGCNANCFYCYEGKRLVANLRVDVADAIIKFIVDNLNSFHQIGIQWFGGEPLVNYPIITYINDKLTEQGIEIFNSMISNASLFNDDIIDLAVNKWHLQHIQITLDGYGEEHNIRKRYTNIDNAFDQTIQNVKKLIDKGIKVSLRLNYDYNNINSVNQLIDYLSKEFRENPYIVCYAYHIFDNANYDGEVPKLVDTYNINKRIVDAGLNKREWLFRPLKRRKGLCGFCSKNTIVINPDGTLLKCSLDENSVIGNVYGLIEHNIYSAWTSEHLDKRCNSCIFLPLCQGGCRASMRNNYTNCCKMNSELLDEVIKDYIADIYCD